MLSIIYTHDTTDRYCKRIADATLSQWSHCILAFHPHASIHVAACFECADTKRVYLAHEGVRGPFHPQEIWDWAAYKPKKRTLLIQTTPIGGSKQEAARDVLEAAKNKVPYARLSLRSSRLQAIAGTRQHHDPAKGHPWTCAETVARCMPPDVQHRYFGIGDHSYHDIMPAGIVMPSVHVAIEAWSKGLNLPQYHPYVV